MWDRGEKIVYLLGFLAIALILSNMFYQGYKANAEFKEGLELIIEEAEEQEKEVQSRVVVFVQEFTGEDVEYLFQENDGYLHVVKAGKELYKVKYDRDDEEIVYVLHKDEVVYER